MLTWEALELDLRASGDTSAIVAREFIGHPRDEGAEEGVGFPRGQSSDWRFPPRADCSSMHATEFPALWDVHIDAAHPRCDLLRHLGSDVVPFVLRGLAAAAKAISEALSFTGDSALPEESPIPNCTPAIVLVAATDDVAERTIDDVTGRIGWAHAYVDPCRARFKRSGEHAILDYTPGGGLHWERASRYADRERARVDLEPALAERIWGCMRSKIGKPYRLDLALRGHDRTASCAGLVASCFPEDVRAQIEGLRIGPCVSPNTLAIYFNVGSPRGEA